MYAGHRVIDMLSNLSDDLAGKILLSPVIRAAGTLSEALKHRKGDLVIAERQNLRTGA